MDTLPVQCEYKIYAGRKSARRIYLLMNYDYGGQHEKYY